jgi:hypothetical protein
MSNLPSLSDYHKIAQQYRYALAPDGRESNETSTLRNFLTGKFYKGESEEEKFVDLVDFICKLDEGANFILDDILKEYKKGERHNNQTEDNYNYLFECIFKYWIRVQSKFEKDLMDGKANQEGYTQALRSLKININRLAQKHEIKKRISKKMIGQDDENREGISIISEHNNDEFKKSGLRRTYFIEDLSVNYYETKQGLYKDKLYNRKIKTIKKYVSILFSFLAAIGEGFINYIAIAHLGALFLIPSIYIIPIAILCTIGGFYTHYYLYYQSIYDGLKGNFFKKFNPVSDKYEDISCFTKIAAFLMGLLSFGGGFCGWAITSYSVSMILTGSLSTYGMLLALPIAVPLALAMTFMYSCTICNSVKAMDENWKKLRDYFSGLKGLSGTLRFAFDLIKLVLSAAIMVTLGITAFILFRGKGVDMLKTWEICSLASAFIISNVLAGINSLVKGVFGVNRIVSMTDQSIAQLSAKDDARQSEVKLNPIQKADQWCRKMYAWIAYIAVFLNAGAKGALYRPAAGEAFPMFSSLTKGAIASCEGVYTFSIGGIAVDRVITESSVAPVSVTKFSMFSSKGNDTLKAGLLDHQFEKASFT